MRQAYSRVGILFKSFVSRDCDLLKRAYVTFIRPVLEYACSVWCPYKVKHITAIEKIQRSFTRRIPSLRDLSYEERLARINLEPLEIRRLKFDLVLHFKISKGLTPFDNALVFTSVKAQEQPDRMIRICWLNRTVELKLWKTISLQDE